MNRLMDAADSQTDALLTAGDPAVFDVVGGGDFAGDGDVCGDGVRDSHGDGDGDGDGVRDGGGDIDGDSDARAPVIICCDHAGLHIPARLGDLGLAAQAMRTHIAFDIGARQVSELLARRLRAPLLLANYSRLVIDLNRHLDDPTLIPTFSDGVEIPGNTGLTAAQKQQRIDELFAPYHAAYRALVDDLQAQFARPLIVAVHSFAPRMRGQVEARPWDFGVLWEEQRAVAEAVIANLRAIGEDDGGDLCIGDNQPYHARAPRGYAMHAHAQTRGVDMALIEIRQDHIEQAAGQRWAADVLYRAVAPLLNYAPAAVAGARRVAGA
ncbi:MAG: N-formylglutamate amidohydrolase [Gammaproteobacteria bacterium]|nr:N-formylglutamate amidohydrolase [Gammaproteobacteria bacterium]